MLSFGKIGWSKSIFRNVRFFKNNPSLMMAPQTVKTIKLRAVRRALLLMDIFEQVFF